MKPFAAEDLFLHASLQGLDGSASHRQTVFIVSRALKDGDHYQSAAWSLDSSTDGSPRQLTSTAFNAQSPVLDPQGQTLAFLSRRGDSDASQVQLLRLDGGEARQLSHSDRALQLIEMWSPDGDRLLLSAKVPWAEDEHDDTGITQGRPRVVTFLPYKLDGSGTVVGHRSILLQVDVATGDERVLVAGDFDVGNARWSPDGQSLAFVRSHCGTQRHLQDLWLADADGANARQVSHELVSISGVRWSPDGRKLAFGGSRCEGDSLTYLWVLDIDSGDLSQPAGDELQLASSVIVWHPDGQRLATLAARRGLHEVVVVDVGSGTVDRVDSGLRHASEVCVRGDRLVFITASLRHPHEVHSVTWDGQDERRHTAFNREWFEARARPRVSKRTFDVPDGDGGSEQIDAWVLLPAEGAGPFPLLVDFHGGPQSDALIDYPRQVYWYELCANGWAVLAPNAVGSSGYGTRFARRLRGHWGELDLPQHLAVIDALQHDGIASKRLACTGKSYGGYLTAWTVGHSDRFKAAVISAPITNIESHAGTSDSGWYVGPYDMDGELTEVRERYHKLSPIEFAHNATAATLLLQGADDQRCPLGQAEEMFASLIRSTRTCPRMVVYPGGSHHLAGTGKPSHRLDYHRRLAAWVQHWT